MYLFFITSPSQLAICTPSVTTTSFLIATSALCRLLLWVKVLDCGIYTRDGKKGWAVHKDFYCIFVSECVSCTLYFKTVCLFFKKEAKVDWLEHLTLLFFPVIMFLFLFYEQALAERVFRVTFCFVFTFVVCCLLTLCSGVVPHFIRLPISNPLDNDNILYLTRQPKSVRTKRRDTMH